MDIEAFFDSRTSTLSYVVSDEETKDAVIIDPVMDYEPASSTYYYESLERIWDYIQKNRLNIYFIMETHAHADHLSGAQELKNRLSHAQLVIGEDISKVQRVFKEIYHFSDSFPTDGSQFDQLVSENETIEAGVLQFKVLSTPGHTPACCSYWIEDAVFTGDALFMPDFGVARCDFPGGSAKDLYHSVQYKLYTLPDHTRVYPAHDYQPGGRELKYGTTIGESKKNNVQINENTSEEAFVHYRTQRDQTLSTPRLLLPSIQVNVDGGRLPPAESNGTRYLKLPIKPVN